MNIEINEVLSPEVGDLIFIGGMSQAYQMITVSLSVCVDGKTEHHRYGLYDIKKHKLTRTFRTDVELRKLINDTECSIKKGTDYYIEVRKK